MTTTMMTMAASDNNRDSSIDESRDVAGNGRMVGCRDAEREEAALHRLPFDAIV